MFIIDKNKGGIDLYTIEAKRDELRKYRETILKSHEQQLFYYILSKKVKTLKKFITSSSIDLNNSHDKNLNQLLLKLCNYNVSDEDNEMIYHYFDNSSLIKKYLDGLMDTNSVVKLMSNSHDCDLYYLVSDITKIDYNHWLLKEVMNLPKELYLLHLLLLGRYEKLENEQITEQLSLFDIKYFITYTENDLKDLSNLGLMPNYNEVMNKAMLHSRILQKK